MNEADRLRLERDCYKHQAECMECRTGDGPCLVCRQMEDAVRASTDVKAKRELCEAAEHYVTICDEGKEPSSKLYGRKPGIPAMQELIDAADAAKGQSDDS